MRTRRPDCGVGLVEFALIVPVVLAVIFGCIDFGRYIQTETTVSDAARQGARQVIANADSSSNPFGSADSNPCQGTRFTSSATGQGCLTDTRLQQSVAAYLGVDATSVSLQRNVNAASCVAPSHPFLATVCVTPQDTSQAASGSAPANCAAAGSTFPAAGSLGDRQTEWTNRSYVGCFLVQVTVIDEWDPLTPLLTNVMGSLRSIKSSTTVVAEY